ncbi:cytochrome P450 CYP749A22-like [Salvia splendens]|uniref:cytochrome P450 CYP749A22-like n=1 Tax=Salvia splendens TaxID=180675 RepID=UPI001C26BB3B|nr:cytochrome P450 CYP749A22-like [Salvia splendens]
MIPLLAMAVSLFVLIIIPSIILYKLCWIPLHLQRLMESQGIRGPPYRFLHGTTNEIIKMKHQTRDAATKDISHDIFPIIQPHLYSWIKLYGNNFLHWEGTEPEIVVSQNTNIVTEPELIKEILSNKEGTYPKTTSKGYIKKLLGDGLVEAEGEKWSKLRKLSNHAFHGDCFRWQERARDEVLRLFDQRNPNSDGLARLKTVNMILYETLRLYRPVTSILRRIDSRVKLGKYEFPANVKVEIPPLAIHRNPDIWGRDAHLFKLERFSQGVAKATNGNPTAFLGFGYGPRTCVGLMTQLYFTQIIPTSVRGYCSK